MISILLVILLICLVSAGAVFIFLKKRRPTQPPAKPEEAPREIPVPAKESVIPVPQPDRESPRIIAEAQRRAQEIQAKALEIEDRLNRREESLEQRAGAIEKRESRLVEKEAALAKKEEIMDVALEQQAGLTRREAEEKLLTSLNEKMTAKRARVIKEAEEQALLEADEKAKEVLIGAMERSATDYVVEATVAKVHLPDEEAKGRIIGREGRNIRALEQATGVDFEIDETPQEVRISSFDPVRREIARRALERLVIEGRIQPVRIEEVVARVKEELDREILKAGRDLSFQAGVAGLPVGVLELLGRLKFRTSYGQNQAEHTLEVVRLAKALAEETNARVDLVAKAALLHDIGKVKTVEEGEGSHIELGREVLKGFGFDEELIHTAMAHHRNESFHNKEAALVYIADAISGSRPGARFEDYDTYIQRITHLEEIAKGFAGVKEAYAIGAGREVRVLVSPEKVNDDAAVVLAHDIAERIEKEATYPGTVKVNVIRELRASDIAK